MEMSTLIVLGIAVFIIVYRIKTWNDVDFLRDNTEIAEEVIEYEVDKVTKKKPVEDAVAPKESSATSKGEILYKKSLKAGVAKNSALFEAVDNLLQDQLVFELASEPKADVTTLITLVKSLSKNDRAVGLIYEQRADAIVIMKSFDVKMQAKDQFKVVTHYAKSVTVKKSDMHTQQVKSTHLWVSDTKTFANSNVQITLK